MAAGQGFKEFVTGEVLTAGDVNGYLMQGVLVFASAAARNAAITSPQEGQFAFTKDTNGLWYYDGAAWVASGATGDIEGVTATSPLTGGGTSGTVTVGIQSATTAQLGAVQLSDSTASTSTTLAATANAVKTTYDIANAAIPKATVSAKGSIVTATAASTPANLSVGTNGQVLKANSATATGLEWGSASATGAGCQATNGGQNCTTGNSTTLSFTAETFDTDAYHDNSVNPSRFTIPTGKGGLYILTGTGQIGGTTGGRSFGFRKNGSVVTTNVNTTFGTPSSFQASFNMTMVDKAVAGDYYEMFCEQTTGSTQTVTANFSLGYLGA